MVSRVLHNGSYYLTDMRPVKERPDTQKRKRAGGSTDPDEIDRPWNIVQLGPFYS